RLPLKTCIFLVGLMLYLGCAEQSQDPAPLALPQKDSVQQWIEWARDSTQLSFDKRKEFLDRAKREAFAKTDDSLLLQELSSISVVHRTLGDSLGFRETTDQILLISEETESYKYLGYSHWDLATFFQFKGTLDSAFYHYRKALNSFELLPESDPNDSRKARMLYNMGRIQDSYKDYLGAETSISTALRIFDNLGDSRRIYNCYNMLGIISSGMWDSEKSLEYYKKAGTYLDKTQSPEAIELLWQNQNNVANVFLRMEDYVNAKTAFLELYENEELKEKDPNIYSLVLTSLAYALFKLGDQGEEVEALLNSSMEMNNAIGSDYNQARTKQYYAELLAARGDTR